MSEERRWSEISTEEQRLRNDLHYAEAELAKLREALEEIGEPAKHVAAEKERIARDALKET